MDKIELSSEELESIFFILKNELLNGIKNGNIYGGKEYLTNLICKIRKIADNIADEEKNEEEFTKFFKMMERYNTIKGYKVMVEQKEINN